QHADLGLAAAQRRRQGFLGAGAVGRGQRQEQTEEEAPPGATGHGGSAVHPFTSFTLGCAGRVRNTPRDSDPSRRGDSPPHTTRGQPKTAASRFTRTSAVHPGRAAAAARLRSTKAWS